MAEIQIIPLISWSVAASALFLAVGLAYRAYLRKKRDANSLGSI